MKKLSILFILALTAVSARAQLTIEGIVTDESEQPLAGVAVIIRGTKIGTITQSDGRFVLPTTESLPITLSVSFIGYRRQDVAVRGNNFRSLSVKLMAETITTDETIVAASRVIEDSREASLTVQKFGPEQFRQSPAFTPFDVLQNATGVDLMTQSLLFKSVNLRGFGSTTNYRFLQLTDEMDNRSPGLGFGFGNVAGLPDLDIERIELVAGASSALYGPDAMQGLLTTTSKNPFTHQGLSAQVKTGVNNVGKVGFGPKAFGDVAIRYAKELTDRLALKINFQHVSGTDFVADDYTDRSTRERSNFFVTSGFRGNIATMIGFIPDTNPAGNLQYEGVNTYGDDINNGGAYTFSANYANASLQNKLVTRTGYTELALLGNNGKVVNNRANVALHYKLPGNTEASFGWYYGNGNLISTGNSRQYFPDYRRHQFKAELRGENFFLRAYTTQQKAEGWDIGQTAVAINNEWKPLTQWATEFGQVYIDNKVSVGLARNEADRGRYLPGSAAFIASRDRFTSTYNTDSLPGRSGQVGTRFRDNSALWHYEGMYNLSSLLNVAEVIVGGSVRHYALNTGGTLVNLQPNGSEYTIDEYGAYIQASKKIKIGSTLALKPTLALRYDKNQYLQGGFTPRISAVASAGVHHIRASWQSAFRNPTPGELFGGALTSEGREVGGLRQIATSADGISRPVYLETDVKDFLANKLTENQLLSRAYKPSNITPEKLQTWEVGYKAVIQNKLSVDAFYFHSKYTDLIMVQRFYQPLNNELDDLPRNDNRILAIHTNSRNDVFVNGFGVALDYTIGRGYTLSGNYTYQVGTVTLRDAQGAIVNDNAGFPISQRKMSNPEVVQKGRNYFNSPESRYNLSLSNARLTDRLGAAVTYRWTSQMWYEQGVTAGDVWLPSWSSLDAQVSYRLPAYKSVLKLGGTNLTNSYYAQGYGLAQVGGMYYVSVTFDELF